MKSQFKTPLFPLHISTPLNFPCASLYVPDNTQHPNRLLPPSSTPLSSKKIIDSMLPHPAHPLIPAHSESMERERSEGQVSSIADIDQTDQNMCIETMLPSPEHLQQQYSSSSISSSHHRTINSAPPSPQNVVNSGHLAQSTQGGNVQSPTRHPKPVDPRLPLISKLTCKDPSELEDKLLSLTTQYTAVGVSTMLVLDGEVQYRIKFVHRQRGSFREMDFSAMAIRKLSLLCGRDLLLPFLLSEMNKMSA